MKKDRSYYFEFKCTDIAKANLFAGLLMSSRYNEEARQFQEMFGIEVQSLNYCHGDQAITTLKSYLQDFIEKLDTIN